MGRLLPISVLSAMLGLGAVATAKPAAAAVLNVPAEFLDIQAAVDAASPGDEIRVRRGTYCGATIDKALTLVGRGDPPADPHHQQKHQQADEQQNRNRAREAMGEVASHGKD